MIVDVYDSFRFWGHHPDAYNDQHPHLPINPMETLCCQMLSDNPVCFPAFLPTGPKLNSAEALVDRSKLAQRHVEKPCVVESK